MSGAGGDARRALLGYETLPWGPGREFATMNEYMKARLDALDVQVCAFEEGAKPHGPTPPQADQDMPGGAA